MDKTTIYMIIGGIVLLIIIFLFIIKKNKNQRKVPVAFSAEEKSPVLPNDYADEHVKTQVLGSNSSQVPTPQSNNPVVQDKTEVLVPKSSPAPTPHSNNPVIQDKTEILAGGIVNLSESEKQAIRMKSTPPSTVGETVVLASRPVFEEPMAPARSIEYKENQEKKIFKWDDHTPLTIGRDPNHSDLTVSSDDFVGRKHALLYKKNDHYFLVDLDSKNGTFINNEPLKGQTEVALSQVFRLGQTEFILK